MNAVSPAGEVRCVEKLVARPFDLSPSQYNDWSIGQYSAVTVQPDGTVIYTDTYAHQVLARTPDGTVSVLAGSGQLGCAADGVPAASATLSLPSALAIDCSGHLLVADATCHQISANRCRPADAAGTTPRRAGPAGHRGGDRPGQLPARAGPRGGAGPRRCLPRLRQLGFQVVRYAGLDRFATAVAIAQQGLASSTGTFLTTGLDFPDALAASAAAASTGAAVLLTGGRPCRR